MTENDLFSQKQSRRSFLNYVLGFGFIGWLGGVLYPVFEYLKPPKIPEFDVSNVSIGNVKDFENSPSKMFKIGNKPGILIKTAEGEYKAFSAVCTHLECTVQYMKDENLIWCACHNGRYDLNGKNISGPPPAPLTPFKIVIQKDEIFVSK